MEVEEGVGGINGGKKHIKNNKTEILKKEKESQVRGNRGGIGVECYLM